MDSEVLEYIFSLVLDRGMGVGLNSNISNLAVSSYKNDRDIVLCTDGSIMLHLFVVHVGGNYKTEFFEGSFLLELGYGFSFHVFWI